MREVRLIGPDGDQLGIKETREAIKIAREMDLDLVEVAPNAKPPVCRIMDYGKYRYEQTIKEKEARKKQVRIEYKEIKIRPKIDPHDFKIKLDRINKFLSSGYRVKVTLMFKGREMAHPEIGMQLMNDVADGVEGFGITEGAPKQEGKNMLLIVSPLKSRERQVRKKEKQELHENKEKETERDSDGS